MIIKLSFQSEVLRQYLNKYFVTVIGLFLAGLTFPYAVALAGSQVGCYPIVTLEKSSYRI